MAYKPKAVRRVYIPKPGSDKKRPLGIPAIEDKVVQKVMADILNVIYEPMFKEFSYGFRPERNCHQALAYLNHMIIKENTNYIVDLDIKGYFDNIDHEWLMKFIEYRIADKVFSRYVRRFLKSGILEQGKLIKLETGTPQGGIVSPILGNIYLHFVLDDWFEKIVAKESKGYAGMVRYADDSVACFEYKEEAEKYMRSVKKRLQKFGLEVSEEKTKIIEFGRQPYLRQQYYGNKKLKTFDFLGFTHFCCIGKNGKFKIRRITSRKKLNAKAKEIKKWLKSRMHEKVSETTKLLNIRLSGYYRYYGVEWNTIRLREFRQIIYKAYYKVLRRRSQRNGLSEEKFYQTVGKDIINPKICVRIVDMSIEMERKLEVLPKEPYALIGQVRFCEGIMQ